MQNSSVQNASSGGKNRLAVEYAGVAFKNPVVAASGTFGFGREYQQFFPIERLGGISSKGLTLEPRSGNPGVRIWETPSGVMNSVGLENPGVEEFIRRDLGWINSLDLVNIVNVGGHSMEDYVRAVERLNEEQLDILELNISCPNVRQGGMNFGVRTETAAEVVRTIRRVCRHKLVVKLSPNAENIVDLAKACEAEGADGISLVNTFLAMAIDIRQRRPVFDNVYAGLSGPAIKPIALRMVHQVSHAVQVPVMGIGGISTWEDALEFILAGATVVQIGSANFIRPGRALEVVDGLARYCEEQEIGDLREIRGAV